ncbi:MAG: glycosyltransferase family 4 protein [Pseudaminobacter sp.]|nr:glycosyltransferase family 4 protein [Pseudaminobacter sp.]
MKILYVHQLFSTRGGAVGTRSYEIARRMVAAGHQVTVICSSYANADTGVSGPFVKGVREGMVDGIRVKEFAIPVGNKLSFQARIGAFIRFVVKSLRPVLRDDYDLLYATSTPLTVAVSGIVAKLARRKRFIFEVRDLWPELPKAMGVIRNPLVLAAMSGLEWSGYRAADACVGLSPGIVEGIRRRTGAEKPILLAPNAADLEFFADHESDDVSIPGIDPGDFVAIFTGTHGIANGLENVLDAAAAVAASPDEAARRIKFVFVGDGNRKAGLMERAEREKLGNCLFLDPVPKARLRGFLRRADVGVMALANVPAFYYGTSPNKFFDYLSASLPVICNYPGWVSDLIAEHDCGAGVEAENPQAFADALVAMAKDRDALATMGANARKLGETKFDRNLIAGQLIEFVEQVADGRA